MMLAVYVEFLPGGSMPPDEFFARINARWYRVEEPSDAEPGNAGVERPAQAQVPRSGICITDYDSVQQLAIDLAVKPDAGIANMEMFPAHEKAERQYSLGFVENPADVGEVWQGGEWLADVSYILDVYEHVLVSETLDGWSSETDGLRAITGTISVLDGTKRLWGRGLLDLHMQDGRSINFLIKQGDMRAGSYRIYS